MSISYITGKSTQGMIFELYNPSGDKDSPIVILAGMNVTHQDLTNASREEMRVGNYFGRFPHDLADETGREVMVVYQGAMSGVTRRLYSLNTEQIQLEAALEVTQGKEISLVTHSLSTNAGLGIVLGEYNFPQIKDVVLSSTVTDAEDALSYNGKDRTFPETFGIRWITLFKYLQHVPIILPTFPLRDQKFHDGLEEKEKHSAWGADRWIDTRSAQWFLKFNTEKRLSNHFEQEDGRLPYAERTFFVIPKEDKIFSPDLQYNSADSLTDTKNRVVLPRAGHRWFTSPDMPLALDEIVGFLER